MVLTEDILLLDMVVCTFPTYKLMILGKKVASAVGSDPLLLVETWKTEHITPSC